MGSFRPFSIFGVFTNKIFYLCFVGLKTSEVGNEIEAIIF